MDYWYWRQGLAGSIGGRGHRSCCCHSAYTDIGGTCTYRISSQRTRARATGDCIILIAVTFFLVSQISVFDSRTFCSQQCFFSSYDTETSLPATSPTKIVRSAMSLLSVMSTVGSCHVSAQPHTRNPTPSLCSASYLTPYSQ